MQNASSVYKEGNQLIKAKRGGIHCNLQGLKESKEERIVRPQKAGTRVTSTASPGRAPDHPGEP